MPHNALWPMEDHTAAKHRLLRAFIDAWLPIMGLQEIRMNRSNPTVRIIDGFAGPGRYAGGEPGSPLILLEAFTEHKALPALKKARFQFLFIESDRVRHRMLEENVAAFDPPAYIEIDIRLGQFERVLDELVCNAEAGPAPPPTFMFVDPFGYSKSGLTITGSLLRFPRCEVLYFLPLTQISRFLDAPGPSSAFTALFGTDEWEAGKRLKSRERLEFLGDLFEQRLVDQPAVEYVRSLRLHTKDGNDYRLVFGLGHLKGLRAAKDAMWRVDPLSGTEYRATGALGQGTLFGTAGSFNREDLLSSLRAHFGLQWFTIEDAEVFTLVDTPYRHGHLKTKTLEPTIKEGHLDVRRASEKGLARGSKLRFLQ